MCMPKKIQMFMKDSQNLKDQVPTESYSAVDTIDTIIGEYERPLTALEAAPAAAAAATATATTTKDAFGTHAALNAIGAFQT
jgi:hypothetical protein